MKEEAPRQWRFGETGAPSCEADWDKPHPPIINDEAYNQAEMIRVDQSLSFMTMERDLLQEHLKIVQRERNFLLVCILIAALSHGLYLL